MLGFLFKILVMAAVVVGVGYFIMTKQGLAGLKPDKILSQLPLNKTAIMGIKNVDTGNVLSQVSGALDNLVTHQSGGSGPVVLGVKVSNDSISTVVDVLQSLPPEQVQQIRTAFCASPSSQ